MYYMTKLGTYITNAVRELTSQMIKPTRDNWKAVERTVGYVLHEPYQ